MIQKVVCCIFFLFTCSALSIYASEQMRVREEVINLPTYDSSIPCSDFTGIGVDGKTGNICLARDGGWVEVAYHDGNFIFDKSFISATKEFSLQTVANAPDGVFVFDVHTQTIMSEIGKSHVSVRIQNPTGMTFHRGHIFLADKGKRIYEIQLLGDNARILSHTDIRRPVYGLASDGDNIFGCGRNAMYQFDASFNIITELICDVTLDGITIPRKGEIIAIAKERPILYRFRY